MRKLVDQFSNAVVSLREQWQRAILSAVGVMVAMIAITLLIGIAKGVKKDLGGQVKDLGVNVLVILPARIDTSQMSMNPNLGGQSYLNKSHAQKLESISGVERTALLTFVGGGIERGKYKAMPILIAAEPNWFVMHQVKLGAGALFDKTNEYEKVCILGGVASKAVFGEEKAVGKNVKINGDSYTVVGVTEDDKSESSLFSMGGFQNVVYLPYAQFHKDNPDSQTDRIMVQVKPEAEPKKLVKEMDAALGTMLDEQQYSVLTQEDLLGLVYKLMQILEWLLTGLTSIALFVGGVGIMAVMLMSVNERTKEIGIRKTVGATRKDIFGQFLVESILITVLGGMAGLTFSAIVSALLSRFTVIKPEITLGLVGFSFAVCISIGVIFGLIPAVNASRKDPVDALRNE